MFPLTFNRLEVTVALSILSLGPVAGLPFYNLYDGRRAPCTYLVTGQIIRRIDNSKADGYRQEARVIDMSAENDSPPPTSAVLMSISKHLATKCNKQSKDYIECKRRDKNPESCMREGDTVTACAIDTLKEAQQKAPKEFKAFYECMDYYSNKFEKCRKEQKAFEEAFPVS